MLRTKKILIGHDFTSYSDAALLEGVRLGRWLDAEIHVAFVEVLHGDITIPQTEESDRVEHFRGELEKRFAQVDGETPEVFSDLNVRFEVLRDIAAGPGLLAYADENDIDLIVVGTHGRRGFQRMLMGSVAEEVVRRARCPVLTVRDELKDVIELPTRRIVAPVDFSEHSLLAVRNAKELAAATGASVLLMHVLEENLHPAFYNMGMFSQYASMPDIEERTIKELKDFYQRAGGPESEVDFLVRRGHAVREITKTAREQAPSIIVMATHGLTGLDHFLMGSVTEKVVRQSEGPVLTIKSYGKRLVELPSEAVPTPES